MGDLPHVLRQLLAMTLDGERALLVNVALDERSVREALRLAAEERAPVFVGVRVPRAAEALLWLSFADRSEEAVSRWLHERKRRQRRRQRRRRAVARSKRNTAS